MCRRWLKTVSFFLFAIITILVVFIIIRTNSEPWTPNELSGLTESLNEAAAIKVPHHFLADESLQKVHAELFARVENGVVLNVEESVIYRQIFQTILHDSQSYLGRFDTQLSVLSDHAMSTKNNASGQGIFGNHDHHDLSARSNFEELLSSLEQLSTSKTPFGRITHANAAQKDLVDLISHIGVAPHTVSVAYHSPEKPWRHQLLGSQFEAMLQAYKAAQFELVNSPLYWTFVDQGLASYDALIMTVQDIVVSNTSSWERRIAGRFLSTQTLAPPVELVLSARRK